MKKRMLSWGLIFSLLLTLLPMPAAAAEQHEPEGEPADTTYTLSQDTEIHSLNGLAAAGAEAHTGHNGWRQFTIGTTEMADGNYCLNNNMELAKQITVSGNVTLCLNSNTLTLSGDGRFTVNSGATLTICDCGGGGTITRTTTRSSTSLISVEGGTLNLADVTINGEASGSGSLISVTDGALNVTGGAISLAHTGTGATAGVRAVTLSNSDGSFASCTVSLTTGMSGNSDFATTVYQQGGDVTVNDTEISFQSENLKTPGSGALCVTSGGAVTVEGSELTALYQNDEPAIAVFIGTQKGTDTADIISSSITGALIVYGEATTNGGDFGFIQNQGTLTMFGGLVSSPGYYGILTNGLADLSDVTIEADIGIYCTGGLPTLRDGVIITASQYGVQGRAALIGAPWISGDTADLYISSEYASPTYPSVDATQYTGDAILSVEEGSSPDPHLGGYIGCAILVPQEKEGLFDLINEGDFIYQYDEATNALRLYNTKSHPICGAECSHGTSHAGAPWQKWPSPVSETLTDGSYYLTGSVTLTEAITVTGEVNLCLNGNTIGKRDGGSPFLVTESGTLTICDCQSAGQLTGGITANGGEIGIYGGTISGGTYAVDLAGGAKLTLSGDPALSGTDAALKLYTQSGTPLDDAAVDATDYTGNSLEVVEDNVSGGVNGFAIKGGSGKFTLKNDSAGYHYAYEEGYVIQPDHVHSYTYSGSGNEITEHCDCGHTATATISIRDDVDRTYTGIPIEPAQVTYSENWQGGTDLIITYSDNVNAGPAKATITKDTAQASVEFTIAKANQDKPTISDYSINYQSETIAIITDGCKVYTDQDAGKEVENGASISGYWGQTLYIRKEESDNYNASQWLSISLVPRPEAPLVTAVDETIQGKSDGKVTGVDDTMEYKLGDGAWQDCTGDEITGLAGNTTVTVRVKATASAPHSVEATCTVAPGTGVLTVTFVSNGGSAVAPMIVDTYNAIVSAPDAPAKPGYTFDGWYREESCATLWDFSTDRVTEDLTLYAKWTLEPPSLTLTATNTSVTYGEEITLTAQASHSSAELTYAWFKDGDPLPAYEDKAALTISNVADSGSYRVEVTATDGDGQQTAAAAALTVSIMPASVELPDPSDAQFTYSGQAQTYPIADSALYTVTGSQQTNAGTYTVTVSLNDKDNYTWAGGNAEDQTYPFTIAPKAITATWSGLTQVYDAAEQVKVTLSGVITGDNVGVEVAGIKETAGSHDLTATLTGTDAPNYTLKNAKEILTIRPKTVGFTVSDNAAESDGTAKTATVTPTDSALTQTGYTVTYRQGAATVAVPTAVGSYEIWVEITDGNYQHTNGKAEMQVGTLTITQAPPVLYDVTFTGGEDATGTPPEALSAVANSKIILPACTFQREHYLFTGWSYGGKAYQPGDSFTMPAQNVAFTAQWQAVFEVGGTITEKTDGEDVKAENAVVSLWLGATKISEVTTGANGTFKFENLVPGIYNLVVTKDVRTVTSKVELTENTTCDATLPKGATNSIVEVTPGSPDIVVGKLDTVFNSVDEKVYTAEDEQTVLAGGKVEITFTAEEKQKTEVSEDLQKIQAVSGESNLALGMDYRLDKAVFHPDGTLAASKSITQANVLLEVLLPLPTELQGKDGYCVYRVHGGQAQELTMTPSADLGEYFTVSSDKTSLTMYVKCFSTYAIGYTESSGSNDGGSSGGGTSTPVYPPSIEEPEHGLVTISPKNPEKGAQVTITPTPDDGYAVDTVIVTDPNGKEVAVTPNADGTYTFVQPSGKVTITVTFRQLNSVSDCPRDDSCPMAPFTDADRAAWYHDGVHYCVEHGLMVGTSQTTFAPYTATTRGMIVTILWRLEGSPIVGSPINYNDVKAEDWYGEAVRWADSAGVVTGYGNGKFGPNDTITREQMAAMLWRYAGSPKVDGTLASFTDGAQTSSWAQPTMIWAVEQGLITGVGNDRLDPTGQATRAQAATILMRFAQDMAQ